MQLCTIKLYKTLKVISALTIALALAAPLPGYAGTPAAPPPGSNLPAPAPVNQRIFGNTLYDTAVKISQSGWTTAATVVLATGRSFPDALAGTVLAHKVNGPLLLTESQQLLPQVREELNRLHPQKVYILGGTAALGPEVETALKAQGYATQRLWDMDQYGTAAKIAAAVTTSAPAAYLVTGENFPDALSISSYAAAQNIPILMTRPDQVPPETLQAIAALGIREVTVIGGPGAIKDTVPKQLAALPNPVQVTARLWGQTQYDTNLAV